MPVETTRRSEVLAIVVPSMVADTRTGVLSVPAFTVVCTSPETGSESALLGDKYSPPKVVWSGKEKFTFF